MNKAYKKSKNELALTPFTLGIKEEISAYKFSRKIFKEIRKSTVRGSKIIKALQQIDYLIKLQENNLQLILQDLDSDGRISLHQTMGSLKAFRTIFNLALLEFSLFNHEDVDEDYNNFEFLPILLSDFDQDEE